jgi:hypothetical protein
MNIGTITREVELLPATTETPEDDDRVTVEPEEVGAGT